MAAAHRLVAQVHDERHELLDRLHAVLDAVEHLPRLRWELTGRNGPHPDIANEHGPEKPSGTKGEERSLVVCVDFKSAESFLAIEPTINACKENEIEIDWRIIKRPPLKEHAMPADTSNRGEMHRFFRSRYIARDLARYAAVELSNIYDEERSDWAHLGLLWLQDCLLYTSDAADE